MSKMISCIGGGETAQTMDASNYKGPGARNGKEREIIAEEPTYMSDRKGHNGHAYRAGEGKSDDRHEHRAPSYPG